MFRAIFWLIIWALSFFMIDIYVVYEDGVRINLKGWSRPLMKWFSERKGE